MDQHFVQTVDLKIHKPNGTWSFQYPKLQHSGGISASITIGVYKLFIPTEDYNINYHTKIFSLILFIISASFLAKEYLLTTYGQLAFLLLISSAGFQFLEPSSELISSTYFFLFLTFLKKKKIILTGITLTLFALSKVEFLVISIFIALYLVAFMIPTNQRKSFIIALLSSFVLLVAPSLFINGTHALLGSRSLSAFQQHYMLTVHDQSATNFSNKEFNLYFPDVYSMQEVLTRHTKEYFYFMKLSLLRSFSELGLTLNTLLLFQVLIFFSPKSRINQTTHTTQLCIIVCLTFALSLLITTAVAFIHTRYLIKFFVPLSIMAIGHIEYSSVIQKKYSHSYIYSFFLVMAICINIYLSLSRIANPHSF